MAAREGEGLRVPGGPGHKLLSQVIRPVGALNRGIDSLSVQKWCENRGLEEGPNPDARPGSAQAGSRKKPQRLGPWT